MDHVAHSYLLLLRYSLSLFKPKAGMIKFTQHSPAFLCCCHSLLLIVCLLFLLILHYIRLISSNLCSQGFSPSISSSSSIDTTFFIL